MIIGFTGTRNGMTSEQKEKVKQILAAVPKITGAVHGVCVGADEDFHSIIRENYPDVLIHGRPGVSAKGTENDYRADCSVDMITITMPYFKRNREIVNECDILIATPAQMTRQQFGGTWYTVGYAEKINKSVYIVLPDGSLLGVN